VASAITTKHSTIFTSGHKTSKSNVCRKEIQHVPQSHRQVLSTNIYDYMEGKQNRKICTEFARHTHKQNATHLSNNNKKKTGRTCYKSDVVTQQSCNYVQHVLKHS